MPTVSGYVIRAARSSHNSKPTTHIVLTKADKQADEQYQDQLRDRLNPGWREYLKMHRESLRGSVTKRVRKAFKGG